MLSFVDDIIDSARREKFITLCLLVRFFSGLWKLAVAPDAFYRVMSVLPTAV